MIFVFPQENLPNLGILRSSSKFDVSVKNLSENPSVRVQNVQLYFLYVVYDSYMCFSLVNTTLGIFFFQIYAICIHTALRNYIFSLHFPIMDHEITTNTFSDGTQLGDYPGHA